MPSSGDPDGGAVIGRHHHHHGGPGFLRAAAALGTDLRAEVGSGDDHRHPPGNMLQHRVLHPDALLVGEHELLGPVGEDAHAVSAGIDDEVDGALLAFEIELAALVEHRRCHREHATIGCRCSGHASLSAFSVIVARHGRAAAPDQEVEIDAFIGLQHVVHVHLHVAAVGSRRRRRPGGTPGGELRLIDMQVQAARRTSRVMRSPLRTRASGPPAAASGATWSTTVP